MSRVGVNLKLSFKDGEMTYLAASYLCCMVRALNSILCSSCRGGFSHLRCDLRNRAKALPLDEIN